MQSNIFESIQKKSLRIILGEQYIGYEEACTLLLAEPLSDRRDTLCLTFVNRAVKNGLHTDIFSTASCSNVTRSNKSRLKEYTCNKKLFSTLPLFIYQGPSTRTLNSYGNICISLNPLVRVKIGYTSNFSFLGHLQVP